MTDICTQETNAYPQKQKSRTDCSALLPKIHGSFISLVLRTKRGRGIDCERKHYKSVYGGPARITPPC